MKCRLCALIPLLFSEGSIHGQTNFICVLERNANLKARLASRSVNADRCDLVLVCTKFDCEERKLMIVLGESESVCG